MANPDQQRIQEQMRERREEQLLLNRFLNVATQKLEDMSREQVQTTTTKQSDESRASSGFSIDTHTGLGQIDELKMGEEEQRIISGMAGMGLREGILASIASFVVLRRGPKYIGRWVQRRQQRASSSSFHSPSNSTFGGSSARSNASYQLSDPRKLTNNSTNNPFEKAANKDFPRPRGFFSRSIWFLFDSVLSLLVGANVSMLYTDKHAIRQQIADLPLVPGRSLTADALCDEVVEELRKVREEKNPTFERLDKMNRDKRIEPTAASFYMEGIVRFCENCERRRYLERRIREESGLDQTAPVQIPTPGVPKDGPRLVVNGGSDRDGGLENPFAERFGEDTTWTNDFVSDDNNNGDSDRNS